MSCDATRSRTIVPPRDKAASFQTRLHSKGDLFHCDLTLAQCPTLANPVFPNLSGQVSQASKIEMQARHKHSFARKLGVRRQRAEAVIGVIQVQDAEADLAVLPREAPSCEQIDGRASVQSVLPSCKTSAAPAISRMATPDSAAVASAAVTELAQMRSQTMHAILCHSRARARPSSSSSNRLPPTFPVARIEDEDEGRARADVRVSEPRLLRRDAHSRLMAVNGPHRLLKQRHEPVLDQVHLTGFDAGSRATAATGRPRLRSRARDGASSPLKTRNLSHKSVDTPRLPVR